LAGVGVLEINAAVRNKAGAAYVPGQGSVGTVQADALRAGRSAARDFEGARPALNQKRYFCKTNPYFALRRSGSLLM
jgi:hypothetical protein